VIEATTSRGRITLAEGAIADLRTRLAGSLLRSGDAGYEAARTIWNRLIDRRPALIARCFKRSNRVRSVSHA